MNLSEKDASLKEELNSLTKYEKYLQKEEIKIIEVCRDNNFSKSCKFYTYTTSPIVAQQLIESDKSIFDSKQADLINLKQLNNFDTKKFEAKEDDNSFQAEEKKSQRLAAYKTHLAKMKGKLFTFQNLKVDSVEQEEILTDVGKQKIKQDEKSFKEDLKTFGSEIAFQRAFNNALFSNCPECKKKINSYIVYYSLIDPTNTQIYNVRIKVRYNSRNEILKLNEGKIVSVSGKLVSFDYEDSKIVYSSNNYSIDIDDFKIADIFLEYYSK